MVRDGRLKGTSFKVIFEAQINIFVKYKPVREFTFYLHK